MLIALGSLSLEMMMHSALSNYISILMLLSVKLMKLWKMISFGIAWIKQNNNFSYFVV